MSDDQDRNDAGQFTAPEPEVYGLESVEKSMGYTKMPDPKAEEDWSFEGPEGDAAAIYEAISEPAPETTEIFYQNPDGSKMDPSLTVTPERAADDLTAFHDANADSAAKSISKDFAAEIDKLRADRLQGDPALEEHYGVKTPKPEKATAVGEEAVAHEPDAFDGVEGLAEETKAALRQPQVREYLESTEREHVQVREAYTNGLENARISHLASLAEIVPHLSGLPPAQFEQGLATLSQVDPPAFQRAMNVLGRTNQIVQAQQQVQAQNAQRARQEFDSFTAAQDAKFHEMVGNDRGKIAAVADEIVDYAAEMGVSRSALIEAMQTQPIMRHAAFQKMMYDAAQFRMMKNAPKPRPARDVPPVQRPGTSRPAGEVASENVQALDRALSKSGSLKDAERLLFARMKGR